MKPPSNHRRHDRESMPAPGGMVLLDLDSAEDRYDRRPMYHRLPLAGLERLARWLLGDAAPAGPYATPGAQRHALVRAITAAEKRMAKAPRARRYDPPRFSATALNFRYKSHCKLTPTRSTR